MWSLFYKDVEGLYLHFGAQPLWNNQKTFSLHFTLFLVTAATPIFYSFCGSVKSAAPAVAVGMNQNFRVAGAATPKSDWACLHHILNFGNTGKTEGGKTTWADSRLSFPINTDKLNYIFYSLTVEEQNSRRSAKVNITSLSQPILDSGSASKTLPGVNIFLPWKISERVFSTMGWYLPLLKCYACPSINLLYTIRRDKQANS